VVYAKAFAGPEAVLAYLSGYTHRVAIWNSRLLWFGGSEVTFYKTIVAAAPTGSRVTLATDDSTRRFLIHVLPGGFHRIRHYGRLAGSSRKDCPAQVRITGGMSQWC
jgi:hypothetical protein